MFNVKLNGPKDHRIVDNINYYILTPTLRLGNGSDGLKKDC